MRTTSGLFLSGHRGSLLGFVGGLALVAAIGAGCGNDEKPGPSMPGASSEKSATSGSATEAAMDSSASLSRSVATPGPTSATPGTSSPSTPDRKAPPTTGASSGPVAPGTIIRWYETRNDGQKTGWIRVAWAPSMWEGKPTIRDTTTMSSSTVRKMMEVEDSFTNQTVTETERSEDGLLWWSRSVTRENDTRTTTSETKWTGDRYVLDEAVGKDTKDHKEVVLAAPVHLDVESMLAKKIAAKSVKPGDRFTLVGLDVPRKRSRDYAVEVVEGEPGPGPNGDVPCTKLSVTDPETGVKQWWWMDPDGAAARMKVEGTEVVRVAESKARARPQETASYSITSGAVPGLERIFSAERVLVDVYVRPDADRPLPEFPTSPFSRVLSVEENPKTGPVIHAELTAYDAPDDAYKHATIPVTDPQFAPDLETNAMLACDHPSVKEAVKQALGDEKDARRAAEKIAEYVFVRLRKQSNAVAEATAPEILKERRGDCSEHARLFVAMCRAAGIPARTCSGYVCIGGEWGNHAWAEIWVGTWIGADPTTNDVGTSARYLLFGWVEKPGTTVGLVGSRAAGRIRLVTTHLDEGEDHVDFTGPESWTTIDKAKGRAVHHLAGIDLRGIPADWDVQVGGDGSATMALPSGANVSVQAAADQGYRSQKSLRMFVGSASKQQFAGATAYRMDVRGRRVYIVMSRRRRVQVAISAPSSAMDSVVAEVEKVMAPTFTPKPIAFVAQAADAPGVASGDTPASPPAASKDDKPAGSPGGGSSPSGEKPPAPADPAPPPGPK